MTMEELNDKACLLYLKERGITEIGQVTDEDREVLCSILERDKPQKPRKKMPVELNLNHEGTKNTEAEEA